MFTIGFAANGMMKLCLPSQPIKAARPSRSIWQLMLEWKKAWPAGLLKYSDWMSFLRTVRRSSPDSFREQLG